MRSCFRHQTFDRAPGWGSSGSVTMPGMNTPVNIFKYGEWSKKVLEITGKASMFQLLTSKTFAKSLIDGNLFAQIFCQGPNGTLIGTDVHGNKYYENKDLGYGRSRWIVYADQYIGTPYSKYSPTSIPPEWHGWVNYINDFPPNKYEFKKPIYAIEANPTKTGTTGAYLPKGSWVNTQKRNWKKYETWTPPASN